MKIVIQLINSKWLINGKQYSELNNSEKTFFGEFLIAMRINIGAENHDKQKAS
jgi:hypothetical protein